MSNGKEVVVSVIIILKNKWNIRNPDKFFKISDYKIIGIKGTRLL